MKQTTDTLPGMIGQHSSMQAVYSLVRAAAASDLPVLIVGETGTGKELVARALHTLSAVRTGPFVDVNCAAIPETLAESELFGWERGAFTGAVARTTGFLETANHGTLFLDEACSLPVSIQAKLLRAIEQKTFRRVGGRARHTAAFRVISSVAENPDLLVVEGRMRPDLLYRLCGVIVQIPPLRERDSDVRLLAEHFLRSSGTASEPRSFSVEAIELIEGHGWPGNVRELKAFVDRLALLVNQSTICADDVVKHLPGLLGQLDERRRIEAVLDANRGDVTKSATALGMSRANLYLKLKKFGVERLPATRSASV